MQLRYRLYCITVTELHSTWSTTSLIILSYVMYVILLCLETSLFGHIKRTVYSIVPQAQLSKHPCYTYSFSPPVAPKRSLHKSDYVSNEAKKGAGSFLHRCSLHFKCVMKAQLALCCKMAPKSLGARCMISAAPGSCAHAHIINSSMHINTPSSRLLPCSRGCLKLSSVVLVEISRCGNTRWCVCMYSMCVYVCLGLSHHHLSQSSLCLIQISNEALVPV